MLPILAWIIALNVAAQENYQPGYIVTHTGDTVKGSVLMPRSGLARYEYCTFRNTQGTITTYQPADVLAYGLNRGSFYEGVPDRNQFMEVLVLGRLDLLAEAAKIFLRDTTGKLHELINTTKHVERNGSPYLYEQKEYVGVMRWLMSDCSQVKGRIDNVNLSAPALTKLVSRYNECVDGKHAVVKQRSKQFLWQVGFMAMYSAGRINGMDDDTYVWTGGTGGAGVRLKEIADYNEISSITAVSYGVYLNVALPGVYKGLSTSMEGHVQQYEFSSSHVDVASPLRTYNNSVYQKIKSVKIPLYAQYEWTGRRRVQPLVFIGADFNFNSGSDSGTIVGNSKEDSPGHYTSTIQYNDVFRVQKFTLGLLGGAGLAVRCNDRLFIELKGRYEVGKSSIQLAYVSHHTYEPTARLTSASVALRYRLTRL